jgi:hypothetical protein
MLSSFGDGGSRPTLDASVVLVAFIASAQGRASRDPDGSDRPRGRNQQCGLKLFCGDWTGKGRRLAHTSEESTGVSRRGFRP